ncbi:MAG: hypothetical protein U1D97_12970 [Desulfuromonadales bacterium]|nr:hypothetical protein [Desulfuromonadales bacterium]
MKLTKTSWCTGLLLLIALFGMTPLCFAAPATTSGKTSMEDVKKETQDLLESLKGYSAAQRDEATARINATLDHLDQRIVALEGTISSNKDKMDAAAREKSRASLAELRRERAKVAELYGSLKSSSVDAWEEMKRVFSDAYISLNETWEKSEIEFGRSK